MGSSLGKGVESAMAFIFLQRALSLGILTVMYCTYVR